MGKSIEVVKALLEEMVSNNYYWSSERATLRRSSDKYDIDAMTFLANRVDALPVRPAVCRGTHPLSATMVLLPLSMSTPHTSSTSYHRTTHAPMLTVQVRRAIPTLAIGSLAPNLRALCRRLITNTELLTPHHYHLSNPNQAWRVS